MDNYIDKREIGHWKEEQYRQRLSLIDWKYMLLNYQDRIIFQGRMRNLKAKKLGSGIVEIFKA